MWVLWFNNQENNFPSSFQYRHSLFQKNYSKTPFSSRRKISLFLQNLQSCLYIFQMYPNVESDLLSIFMPENIWFLTFFLTRISSEQIITKKIILKHLAQEKC